MASTTAIRTIHGPRGHFLWGSLPEVQRDRLGFVLDLALQYGDVAKILTIFAGLILALAACSSAPKMPTLDPTQAAQMLAGMYSKTISDADIGNLTSHPLTRQN
jgi:hypothetical protein